MPNPGVKVPVSILSGFLGSGKTTLLKEILENKGGMKFGVIVNDVASINIDAKLVRERTSTGIQTKSGKDIEFVELENGCACCNASEELLGCILQLVDTAAVKGLPFDRILVELSGVAEPKNVRAEFQSASAEGHPAFEAAELSTVITVVDSPHFFDLYSSKHDVADMPQLLGTSAAPHAGAVTADDPRYEEMRSVEVERSVVDLLVEQVECADVVVLNKADRVPAPRLEALHAILAALNPAADLLRCSFGRPFPAAADAAPGGPAAGRAMVEALFGPGARGAGVMQGDEDEDLRRAVRLARQAQHEREQAAAAAAAAAAAGGEHECRHAHGHDHAAHGGAHGHDHAAHGGTHGHEGCNHGHGGGGGCHAHEAAHGGPDAAQGHGHGHDHGGGGGGGGAHEHAAHGHSHAEAAGGHAHGHEPAAAAGRAGAVVVAAARRPTSAADKYGITSFVYSRRRPFQAERLMKVVAALPVKAAPRKDWFEHVPAQNWTLDKLAEGRLDGVDPAGRRKREQDVMHAVIRSKGFVWLAGSGDTAMLWSHAGSHFDMHKLGLWWAATPLPMWPDGGDPSSAEVAKLMAEFDLQGPHGDRRQELVFIGIGMDQAAIEGLLDACLLTDAELDRARRGARPDPVRLERDPRFPARLRLVAAEAAAAPAAAAAAQAG